MIIAWSALWLFCWLKAAEAGCSPTSYYRNCWIRRFPGLYIAVEESERRGAVLLQLYQEESALKCSRACCLSTNFSCNLAVFHYNTTQDSANCFHLHCPTLESCILRQRGNAILYNVTKGVDPDLLVFGNHFTSDFQVLPNQALSRLNNSEPFSSDKRQFNRPHVAPSSTTQPATPATTASSPITSLTSDVSDSTPPVSVQSKQDTPFASSVQGSTIKTQTQPSSTHVIVNRSPHIATIATTTISTRWTTTAQQSPTKASSIFFPSISTLPLQPTSTAKTTTETSFSSQPTSDLTYQSTAQSTFPAVTTQSSTTAVVSSETTQTPTTSATSETRQASTINSMGTWASTTPSITSETTQIPTATSVTSETRQSSSMASTTDEGTLTTSTTSETTEDSTTASTITEVTKASTTASSTSEATQSTTTVLITSGITPIPTTSLTNEATQASTIESTTSRSTQAFTTASPTNKAMQASTTKSMTNEATPVSTMESTTSKTTQAFTTESTNEATQATTTVYTTSKTTSTAFIRTPNPMPPFTTQQRTTEKTPGHSTLVTGQLSSTKPTTAPSLLTAFKTMTQGHATTTTQPQIMTTRQTTKTWPYSQPTNTLSPETPLVEESSTQSPTTDGKSTVYTSNNAATNEDSTSSIKLHSQAAVSVTNHGSVSTSPTPPTTMEDSQPYPNDTKGYISRNITTGDSPRPGADDGLMPVWHLAANTVLVALATCATIAFGCCCSVLMAVSWRGRRRRKGRYQTTLSGKKGSMRLIKYVIVRESL